MLASTRSNSGIELSRASQVTPCTASLRSCRYSDFDFGVAAPLAAALS